MIAGSSYRYLFGFHIRLIRPYILFIRSFKSIADYEAYYIERNNRLERSRSKSRAGGGIEGGDCVHIYEDVYASLDDD